VGPELLRHCTRGLTASIRRIPQCQREKLSTEPAISPGAPSVTTSTRLPGVDVVSPASMSPASMRWADVYVSGLGPRDRWLRPRGQISLSDWIHLVIRIAQRVPLLPFVWPFEPLAPGCRSCAPPASSLTPRSAWAPRPSAGSPGHNHLEAGRDRALDLHGLGRLAKAAIGQPLERLRDFRHGGVVRAAGDDEAPLFGPRPRRPGNGRRDLGRLESGRTPRHAPASRRSLREGVRCAV